MKWNSTFISGKPCCIYSGCINWICGSLKYFVIYFLKELFNKFLMSTFLKFVNIISFLWVNGWLLLYELSGYAFESRCCHLSFRNNACFKEGVPWGCNFTFKRVYDMIITYSLMHRTDKYSHCSSIIWPVWLNGWVYELSGCGFESRCYQQFYL